MAGLMDLLTSDMGKQIIGGVSQETNQSPDKTAKVLQMALPVLMGAMKRNAATPQGAEGLMGALSNKHDGSILDNLGDLFNGGVNDDVKQDGAGILGHILGGGQDNVTNALSSSTGVDSGSVGNILKVAAPILLGFLGKEKRQQNVQSSSGIDGLLGGLMGGNKSSNKQQSMIEQLLDGNNDGSILDDVAGMLLNSGGSKKKGGLGGLLGGLFGR
ncbi:MAG: DUF937 domain-containing protein [Gilvibacter sp.]